MLNIMNQMAADLPNPPTSGAKVGPRARARSSPRRLGPRVPSQTMGRTQKYIAAMAPLASIERGRFLAGSAVSPTWQAAASKAGAAKPIR